MYQLLLIHSHLSSHLICNCVKHIPQGVLYARWNTYRLVMFQAQGTCFCICPLSHPRLSAIIPESSQTSAVLRIRTECGMFWSKCHEHGRLFEVKQIRRDLVRLLETLQNRGEWQRTSPSKLEPLIILKAPENPNPSTTSVN